MFLIDHLPAALRILPCPLFDSPVLTRFGSSRLGPLLRLTGRTLRRREPAILRLRLLASHFLQAPRFDRAARIAFELAPPLFEGRLFRGGRLTDDNRSSSD
jgi:hypothetical protein